MAEIKTNVVKKGNHKSIEVEAPNPEMLSTMGKFKLNATIRKKLFETLSNDQLLTIVLNGLEWLDKRGFDVGGVYKIYETRREKRDKQETNATVQKPAEKQSGTRKKS